MARHIGAVIDPLVLSEYHSTLAELSQDTNRREDARKHWRIAIQAAEAVGNDEDLAFCRSEMAEFERKHNRPRVSITELETVLKMRLSPEERAVALTQLLNVLLQAKFEKRAAEVFDLAQAHMRKHGFRTHLIDIHMSLFDHNWSGNRESQLNSLQAYAVAFIAAANGPEYVEEIATIMSHVIRSLTDRTTAPQSRRLTWLQAQFEKWLREQIGERGALMSTLMAPVRYASRVFPFRDDPEKLLAAHDQFYAEIN